MREREDIPPEPAEIEHYEPSLGERLREARESGSLSMRDIAEELRVEPRVLESLEADNFDGLGAPVFVKGYIKQYGRQLGLKYEDLLGAYYRQVGAQEVVIQPTRSIQLRDEGQITAWIVAALVLLLLVVVLFVWWLGGDQLAGVTAGRLSSPSASFEQAPDAGTPPPALPTSAEALAASPLAPILDESNNSAEPGGPATALPGSAVDAPGSPTAAPGDPRAAPVGPTLAVSAADRPSELRAGSDSLGPGLSPTQEAAIEAGLLPVSIEFVQDCWTDISDARGEQLYYDLGTAGTAVTLYGEPPIKAFFGNADGVRLTVDGDAYSIPLRNRRGNLANLIINPIAD